MLDWIKNWHGERTINPKPVEDAPSILFLSQCFIRVANMFCTDDRDVNQMKKIGLVQYLNGIVLISCQ